MPKRTQSDILFEECRKVLAGGVGSQARAEVGASPLFMDRGAGSRVYDVDGNEYIDYALAFGPLILGHCHPRVMNAVRDQLNKGTMFGACNELTIDVSRKIIENVPCADLVRFGNSGSDANHAALRVARAYTGKSKAVKFEGHYHGWFDSVYAVSYTHLRAHET